MHQIIKLSNVKLQMRVGKKHSAGLNRLSLFVVQQAFDKRMHGASSLKSMGQGETFTSLAR